MLTGIKRLLYDDGKTIKKVCEILQSRGVNHVRSLASAPVDGHDDAESVPETGAISSGDIPRREESGDAGIEIEERAPVSLPGS